MRFHYVASTAEFYVTGLYVPAGEDMLYWSCSDNTDILLVQSEYGKAIYARMEEICEKAGHIASLSTDSFTEIGEGISLRRISGMENAKVGSCCRLARAACRYTAFACKQGDSLVSVYMPNEQSVRSGGFCDVPLRLRAEVGKEENTGVLSRLAAGFQREERQVFFLKFSLMDDVGQYQDGAVFYEYGDFRIPITGEMLRRGTVYVRTERQPILKTTTAGLELLMAKGA